MAEAEATVRTLIRWAGDNQAEEGLIGTPNRVTETLGVFAGYEEILLKCFKEHLKRRMGMMRWFY